MRGGGGQCHYHMSRGRPRKQVMISHQPHHHTGCTLVQKHPVYRRSSLDANLYLLWAGIFQWCPVLHFIMWPGLIFVIYDQSNIPLYWPRHTMGGWGWSLVPLTRWIFRTFYIWPDPLDSQTIIMPGRLVVMASSNESVTGSWRPIRGQDIVCRPRSIISLVHGVTL